MKIVIAGGTGLVGRRLIAALRAEGHDLVNLSRRARPDAGVRTAAWDAQTLEDWTRELDGAAAVINLAGEPINARRWSAKQKQRISKSRVGPTRALVAAMEQAARKPKVFVSSSAVGYYGDVPEGEVTESRPKGSSFLSDVSGRWEAEAKEAEKLGVRVVLLRTGIVLDAEGGALPTVAFPFKLFAGGSIGSGKQWIPWIHWRDEIGLILHALRNERVSGPMNAGSPQPVRMKGFAAAVGRALGRPSWLPVPGFAMRILLGEMSELVLTGQKVIPQKALDTGYRFAFPDVDSALREIYP